MPEFPHVICGDAVGDDAERVMTPVLLKFSRSVFPAAPPYHALCRLAALLAVSVTEYLKPVKLIAALFQVCAADSA